MTRLVSVISHMCLAISATNLSTTQDIPQLIDRLARARCEDYTQSRGLARGRSSRAVKYTWTRLEFIMARSVGGRRRLNGNGI